MCISQPLFPPCKNLVIRQCFFLFCPLSLSAVSVIRFCMWKNFTTPYVQVHTAVAAGLVGRAGDEVYLALQTTSHISGFQGRANHPTRAAPSFSLKMTSTICQPTCECKLARTRLHVGLFVVLKFVRFFRRVPVCRCPTHTQTQPVFCLFPSE